MSNKVQSALDAREARRKKELQDKKSKVTDALEARKQRNAQNKDEYLSAFYDKLTSEVEAAKGISTPSFGSDSFKTAVETTRDRRLAVDELRRDADAYRIYIGDEAADELLSHLETLAGSYDSYLKTAEFYSQFKDEDAYNKWEKSQADMQEVLNSEDFADKSGYVSTKSDKWHAGLTTDYGLGYNDLTYEYINNQDGIRDEIKKKHNIVASDKPFDNGESKYEERGYDFLDKNEIAIYNYYYTTEGSEKAQEFLDSMESELVYRKAQKEFKSLEGRTLAEIFYGAVTGIEQWASGVEGLGYFITGDEGHISSTEYLSQMIREDLADDGFKILGSSVGQIGYDLVNTTSNMLPSIIVGAVTGSVGGTLTLAASAVGNSYTEMRSLGYNEWQSRGYATLVGASEGLLQYFLGGINKLGGKVVSGKAVTNLVSKFDNAIAKTAIKLGGNMLSEGAEEAIQTVLEPAFKALVTGEDFEAAEWEDVWYSALLGALSAGALEGAPSIATDTSSRIQAKKTYADGGKALVDAGIESGGLAKSIAEKYKGQMDSGKKLTGTKLLNLEEAIAKQDRNAVKESFKSRLTEVGEKGNVEKLAEILTKQAMGEELNLLEESALNKSKEALGVLSEIIPENKTDLYGKIESKLGKARLKVKEL